MEITYINRKTNTKAIEKVYGARALTLLYGSWRFVLPLITRIPFFSYLYGFLQKRPASKKKVAPFIKAFHVDATEFATQEFCSFNDFFTRKLRPECRPINADPNTFVMPADGRYLVYPRFDDFVVKGQVFSLSQFLNSEALANRYKEGSLAIIRLCPVDYHRFHFPCDATPSLPILINGPLYSVNPIAIKKRLSILAENKRVITELDTERFGKVLFIEIGATFVGSIHQTHPLQKPVRKGDEKGYFEFGGSCIVLLFEKNHITFDADLIENTAKGFETLGQFGMSLAKCKAAIHSPNE